jgi:hypothetical protein
VARTRGGRHSFAWRRRTENPPWVLVSDGVRILQKECTTGLGDSGRGGSGNVGRFTCCKEHEAAIFWSVDLLHMDRIIKGEDEQKFREDKRRQSGRLTSGSGCRVICASISSVSVSACTAALEQTRGRRNSEDESFNCTLSSTLTTLQRILLGTWNILICPASSAESLGSCSCQQMKKR